MHRLAATPGGWDSRSEGVIFIAQTPAPIVFLSAADTDIAALSRALVGLPDDFSDVRSVNLLQLQQQLTIDTYVEDVLSHAQLIILRLLGGRAYWSYGLEVLRETVTATGAALAVLPGEDKPDLDLMSHSTLPLSAVNQLWRYFTEGGIENVRNALLYASNLVLSTEYQILAPQSVPKIGLYSCLGDCSKDRTEDVTNWKVLSNKKDKKEQILKTSSVEQKAWARVGILFYRAHYLSGNTKIIDAIADALVRCQLAPVPIYVSSLKALEVQQALVEVCQPEQSSQSPRDSGIELLINTTSFAISSLDQSGTGGSLWQQLDVPVLQAICSGSPRSQWQAHPQGLTPRDIAMNVALPEVDGRIVTRAVSFKASAPLSL